MLKKNKGFTLIEIIVTVIIIGILVTIAIPNYVRSAERARSAQAVETLKNMRTAAINYYTENDTWTGVDRDTLATEAGANFDDNTDWTYTASGTDSTVTLTANRQRGHWAGRSITLDQDENWSDPSSGYPWDDAGAF